MNYLSIARGDESVRAIILIIRVSGVSTDDIDVTRDGESEHLLPCPEWLGLEDCWLRHLAIPGGKPHEQVHHFLLHRADVGHMPVLSVGQCLNRATCTYIQ